MLQLWSTITAHMCTIGKYTLALGASASSGWQSLYLCDQAALLQLLFDQDIARPRRLARASALQDLGRTFFAAAVEARKRNDERVQGFVRAGQDMRLFAAMQERLFEVVHRELESLPEPAEAEAMDNVQ